MNNFGNAMYWYASDDYNIPYTGDFIRSGVTSALVPYKLVASAAFPSAINFEPGDIVASDVDWKIAQIIKREDDSTLLLDKDIFTAIGGRFRIYRRNDSVGGTIYNIAGTAKDFTVEPLGLVVKYASQPLFTVESNSILPLKVIRVLDTGSTMKKFMILY